MSVSVDVQPDFLTEWRPGSPAVSWGWQRAGRELLRVAAFLREARRGGTTSVWVFLPFFIKKFCQILSVLRENIQNLKSNGIRF